MQPYEIQADFFKSISSPVRIKILKLLISTNSCVTDIAGVLKEPQPQVSKALIALKKAGIVESSRTGKKSCYSIKRQEIAQILALSEKIITTESEKVMLAFNKRKAKAV